MIGSSVYCILSANLNSVPANHAEVDLYNRIAPVNTDQIADFLECVADLVARLCSYLLHRDQRGGKKKRDIISPAAFTSGEHRNHHTHR
jgi:hypothetical protein